MQSPKPFLAVLTVVGVLTSCAGPHAPDAPAEPTASDDAAVRFEQREITAESPDCDVESSPCARLRVVLAETVGGGTQEVRDNLDMYTRHWVVSRLREHLAEGVGRSTASIDDLAAAFLAQHRAFTVEFPDASADWSIEIVVNPVFSSAKVATLDLSTTSYTGGAHPNSRRQLVSFAVDGGQLLGAADLTADLDALTTVVERRFRDARGLAPDDDLEAAGFWFPDNRFTLPDNLGLIADGLLVHWDAYEIAPYSMGPITVEVPVDDLQGVVDRWLW
jgi:hypothetical protein